MLFQLLNGMRRGRMDEGCWFVFFFSEPVWMSGKEDKLDFTESFWWFSAMCKIQDGMIGVQLLHVVALFFLCWRFDTCLRKEDLRNEADSGWQEPLPLLQMTFCKATFTCDKLWQGSNKWFSRETVKLLIDQLLAMSFCWAVTDVDQGS